MPYCYTIIFHNPIGNISLLYLYLKDLSKRIIIDKDINALFFSIIFIPTLVILIYGRFFLTVPPQLLKIGYFEANLTLDKEYVDKTELKTYLEKCQPKCLDKQPEEKNKTKKIQEKDNSDNQSQDTQNNNYCILENKFRFFIFLRTKSEYIVGCSKNSNVRIHIPADKVIAIEYKD